MRLNALIESRVIQRATLPSPYNAQVYELTPIGRELQPAIRELIRWGGHFLFPMHPDDQFEPDWVLLALDAIARRSPSPKCKIALRLKHGDKAATFVIEGGPSGTTIVSGEAPGAVAIEARFDVLLQVIAGALRIEQAAASGLISVEGSMRTAGMLPRLFDLAERRGRT